jgi:hypothetical protein
VGGSGAREGYNKEGASAPMGLLERDIVKRHACISGNNKVYRLAV